MRTRPPKRQAKVCDFWLKIGIICIIWCTVVDEYGQSCFQKAHFFEHHPTRNVGAFSVGRTAPVGQSLPPALQHGAVHHLDGRRGHWVQGTTSLGLGVMATQSAPPPAVGQKTAHEGIGADWSNCANGFLWHVCRMGSCPKHKCANAQAPSKMRTST